MKQWASAIATDAVMFGMLYLWLWHGIEGAENVFKLAFWFLAGISLLIAFVGNEETWKTAKPRSKAFAAYHVATDLVMIGTLAWFGHLWMAGFMMVAKAFYEAARGQEMRRRAA